MKKAILMLVMLLSITFATNWEPKQWVKKVQGSVDSITTKDSMFVVTFNTKWRSNFKIKDMTGPAYPDYSTMTWVFNVDKGIGFMIDETENITSIYKLENIGWYAPNDDGEMMITCKATSNVGHIYQLIINDNNKSVIFSGPMGHIVIRRYYFK